MINPASPAAPAMPDLQREFADASSAQILKIVAAVEAVANRGQADAMISPLRGRLTALRPPRRLRFSRLLFHPLNPLVVPGVNWRSARPQFPRSAIAALANYVRTAMGPAAASIEAEIAGRTTADVALVDRLGRKLWPAAAPILASAGASDDWQQTGFSKAQFETLALAAAALLSQAAALDALCIETADGLQPPRPEALHAILRDAAKISEAALPMMVSLVLVRLPEAAAVLTQPYTGAKAAAIQEAMEQAANVLMDRLTSGDSDAQIESGTLANVATSARRTAVLLSYLDTAVRDPARKLLLGQIRDRLDAACQSRFRAGLENDVLVPLRNTVSSARPDGLPAVETAARGLRVLEIEARAIGHGRTYDALLAQASETLKSASMADRVGLPHRVRLVELLETPEAALAMLRKGR